MKLLQNYLILILKSFSKIVGKTKLGQFYHDQIIEMSMQQTLSVNYNQIALKLTTPTGFTKWRARTFSTKEPETLDWIDTFPENAIFWDIGANIGLYSLYAAKKKNCLVWSFEPSIFNLELLGRNIFCNGLVNNICIVPLALSDKLGFNVLHMTSTKWSGALSTFGEKFGWDGKDIKQVFEFKTIGLNIQDAIDKLEIKRPDFIKIDVDGIEHLILMGGLDILRFVKSVHIEINDEFSVQKNKCEQILLDSGFKMIGKRHSDMIESSEHGYNKTFNQTWVKI